MFTNEQKENIKSKLLEKIPTMTCPMCQNKGFTMSDGYFLNSMQVDLTSVNIGGQAIPTIGIICNNCGFLSQHAIGRLGLLPIQTKTDTDEPK